MKCPGGSATPFWVEVARCPKFKKFKKLKKFKKFKKLKWDGVFKF